MSPSEIPPDCRCAVCGVCRHDHHGWVHEWVQTEDGYLPGVRAMGMSTDREMRGNG